MLRSRKKKTSKKLRKGGLLRNLLRSILLLGASVGVVVVLVYGLWAMTFNLDQIGAMPQRSAVFDMDGNLYSRLHGENRILLPGGEIPKNFRDALLAREDSRFYRHFGIDPIGISRAVVRNLFSGRVLQGGSTLTQQLAKNSYQLTGRSLNRKLLEAMLALRIEHRFTKDEILLHYMNRIYYGSGLYGVETASQAYFDKTSDDLTIGQAALLAGLIRSPTRFSPFNNLTGALRERDTVLQRMQSVGMIDEKAEVAARKAPIGLSTGRSHSMQENYAMDAVRRDLDLILAEKDFDEGGLRIYTTLDPLLMRTAANALDAHLTEIEKTSGYSQPRKSAFTDAQRKAEVETPYIQGAVVVIDNRNGGIRALVGGRDFAESKYNRAIMAQRQIGSSFKPFVYAAAFDQGLFPGTLISDGPIQSGEIRSVSSNWSPSNSDGKFMGNLPAREGLIQSRNTMSVRVGEIGGLEHVRDYGIRAGLGDAIPLLPAIYLGAFEASLKDLTTAYTIFPNQGVRKQSFLIERIDDVEGRPIYLASHVQMQALPPEVAWMTGAVMGGVMDGGTGSGARSDGFRKPAGGKTGTTNDYTDAWFVGFTSSLTCGVWVGMDRPERIMSQGYGSRLALPIWTSVMKAAPDKRYPATDFSPPVQTRRTELCSVTGRLATTGCRRAGTNYALDIPSNRVPASPCTAHEGGLMRARDGDSAPDRVFRTLKKFFRR